MQLLSFVGTGKYMPVQYQLGDGAAVETCYAAEAIALLLPADKVLLALTADAAKHPNAAGLQRALEARHIAWEPLAIPDGKSQAELWQFFGLLAERLQPSATAEPLCLDITHGFRSLPSVTLLAITYLQTLGRTRLARLFYGAYEARDAGGKAPIFDLTPMIKLADWAQASRYWIDRGDARHLGQLLRQANGDAHRAGAAQPRRLGRLATALENVSEGFLLGRPGSAESAARLREQLNEAGEEMEQVAPPLSLLHGLLTEPLDRIEPGGLGGQYALMRWQFESGNSLAAALLAREWVINLLLQRTRREDRDEMEDELNRARFAAQEKKAVPEGNLLAGQPDAAGLIALWSRLSELRNDLAHCGYRPAPLPLSKIHSLLAQSLDEIAARIGNLAEV